MPDKKQNQVLLDATSPDLSELVGSSQRRVLIMSEKRSGGQAMGGILNADPRVFYVADPCRMGGGPEALDAGACSLSISRLLACQPTINDIRNLFSFSYIVERVSEGLGWGGCAHEPQEILRFHARGVSSSREGLFLALWLQRPYMRDFAMSFVNPNLRSKT